MSTLNATAEASAWIATGASSSSKTATILSPRGSKLGNDVDESRQGSLRRAQLRDNARIKAEEVIKVVIRLHR
jgi:hypothetical protein